MNESTEHELEKFIDDELRRLPAIVAPHNLVEGVMNTIQVRQNAPWWKKSFWSWPPVLRALALGILVGMSGGTMIALASYNFDASITSPTNQWISSLWAWGSTHALPLLDQASVWISHPHVKSWLVLSLLIGSAAYLTVIGLGSACFQIAFQPKREG